MTQLLIHHKHGGRITAITKIAHDTEGKGKNKRAFWFFVGDVDWFDATRSKSIEIAPIALCCDQDNPEAKAQLDKILEALHSYLLSNGEWTDRGVWVPQEPHGFAPVTFPETQL